MNNRRPASVGPLPVPPIAAEEFALLRDYLYRHVGIRLKESKKSLVQSRLRQRLSGLGLDSWGAYYAYLLGHDTELPLFVDALTTNETFFMREEEHWEFLRRTIVPEIVAQRRDREREFAAWSAAASSGEELYSTAMVLRECLLSPTTWRLRLVGSDVNAQVLASAREGVYGEYALRQLVPNLRRKYFAVEKPGAAPPTWRISAELRKSCRFVRHNLLHTFPEGGFDLVLCRNVFIYFDERAKRRALRHLVTATAVGGYLVFSHTEAMIPRSAHLAPVHPSIFRRIS